MARLPIDPGPLNEELERLRGIIGADAVFLVDEGGFMLAGTPTGDKFDLESMASLSAGNYLSGMELAKLLRIDDFQSFFLGSGKKVDYFQIGDEGLFLAILQPRKAPLAEVIDHCHETLEKIHKYYDRAAREARGADVVLSDRRMFTSITSGHAAMPNQPDAEVMDLTRCSFCGKTADDVSKLIKGARAMICDECIKLMSEVLFVDLL